ncbi:MAG: hypothetical protein Q9170_002839 [Blastenia crenularia]
MVPPRCRTTSTLIRNSGPLENIDPDSPRSADQGDNDSNKENQDPLRQEPRLSFEIFKEEVLSFTEPTVSAGHISPKDPATASVPRSSRSFKRWISDLRPKSLRHTKTLTTSTKRWPIEESPSEQDARRTERVKDRQSRHRKTNSGSSTGTTKEGAMARPNNTPASRKSRRSNLFSRSNRNSKISEDQTPTVNDHLQGSSKPSEEAAVARSVQRRKTMEELIDSEASYVADLKVLIHAYFTLLASSSQSSHSMSTQIHQNVTEILELHEDILDQIRHIVKEPILQTITARRELPPQTKQPRVRSTEGHRITSAVAGLVHAARTSIDSGRPGQVPDPSTPVPADISHVSAIIKVFEKMLGRFFVYEEYGAHYELMLRNMALTSKSISNWHAFERSIEALANSLAMSSGSEESARKGLAFDDLLIKPIQRLCRYPLLFEELYSNTSESDDAGTRAELGKLLIRLREVTNELNRAANDRETQARIQRAWRLQDILVLPEIAGSPGSIRLLGHPIVSGVLYVAWESANDVCGDYMLCVLFKSYLLLAMQQLDSDHYNVIAIIGLSEVQLQKVDDGRGLQCHTASFSWKMLFESSQQLYELIFCACSSMEEQEWTRAITQHIQAASATQQDEVPLPWPIYTTLALDVKPLGPVFGIFGSTTRRLSIQRAATVHSRTNGAQVIIRNTTATKENKDEGDSIFDSISRSKSVMTASRVPILAPKRADRSRMELSLAEIWSRDRLPFPGMSTHRGDHPLRASASSMMRRLSRASISSAFSKRSASTTSIGEIKPGASVPDLQNIGEGDNEHDPRLGAYQSLRSTPTLDQSSERQLRGSGKLVRAGIVKGVKLSDATNQAKARDTPRYSAQTVRIESTEKGSPRVVRKRRSVPGGLLNRFSTDGMKTGRA